MLSVYCSIYLRAHGRIQCVSLKNIIVTFIWILVIFLVVDHLCLNVKDLKIVHTFSTKISDSIHNYVHHGRNHPHVTGESYHAPIQRYGAYAHMVRRYIYKTR